MPAAFTTLVRFSASADTTPNSAAVVIIGRVPSSSSRARMSGFASPALMSRLRRAMISGGVPRGAPTPPQVAASYPGTVSAMVGVGEQLEPFGACHRDRPQLAGADLRQCRHHHVDADLHLPADQIGHHRRAAAIGHVHHVDAGHHLEQLAGEVRRRAGPERGHADLARIGLGVGDRLGDGLGRHRRVRDQHHGIVDQPGDRRDVALQVEPLVLRQDAVDEGGRAEEQACSRRAASPATAWARLLLAPGRFSMTTCWPSRSASRRHDPGDGVGAPPGGNPTIQRSCRLG